METLNRRIDYVEEDIKELKQQLSHLDAKIENTHRDIMKEVEKNQQDIKALLKEQEISNKEKNTKLFASVEKLTESQYQQTLMQKDIQNDLKTTVRDFTELSKELKENDKWKTRTIFGFIISIILMIIGTFWNMTINIALPFF